MSRPDLVQVRGKELKDVLMGDAVWVQVEDGSIQQTLMQTLFKLLQPHGFDLINDVQVSSTLLHWCWYPVPVPVAAPVSSEISCISSRCHLRQDGTLQQMPST